jgi:hypothetical protein
MTTIQLNGQPPDSVEDLTTIVEDMVFVSSNLRPSYEVGCLTSSDGVGFLREPIKYRRGNPIVDPVAMTTGYPYMFMLFGEWACAIKETDGAVSFYGFASNLPDGSE